MGCGGSKGKIDTPLTNLCRERKHLIEAAADHRYALAAAHLSYFTSLRDVGDALCRFVEEEIIVNSVEEESMSSSFSGIGSPVLILPSDEGKHQKKKQRMKKKKRKVKKEERLESSSSSAASSVSHEIVKQLGDTEGEDDKIEGSHLHLSDSEGRSSGSGHIEIEDEPELDNVGSYPKPGITYTPNAFIGNPYGPYPYPYNRYGSYYNDGSGSFGAYYMKKVATVTPSIMYEEPKVNPIYVFNPVYSGYQGNGNAGYDGFMGNVGSPDGGSRQRSQQVQPPPAPPAPEVSSWDYLNPFEVVESSFFPEYYRERKYRYGSSTSSPDSKEVREREGIPDLEEETENEVLRESFGQEKSRVDEHEDRYYRNRNRHTTRNLDGLEEGKGDNFGEGMSEVMPVPVQVRDPQELRPVEGRGSSPGSDASTSNRKECVEENLRGVGVEEKGAHSQEIGSPKISSFNVVSTHGARDLREVARDIKDEFCAAADYGKEVSVLLETGKRPYHSRGTFLGVKLARFLNSVAPAMSSFHAASNSLPPLSSRRGKTSSDCNEGSLNRRNYGSLASTLDKLCMWEKKLYEEVKAEERLRISYEKQCRKLKSLDERGADTGKIEAAQASIRKLLTKIDVSIRAVEAISNQIHKLRDEELQPQLAELITGLRRMWSSMLKSHHRQFQAILESKTQTLKANTGLRKDSSVRATLALEMELLKWCSRFNHWIDKQRFYAESLNGWLLRCLLHEPEETPDGIVPFSPGRIGAPPVFIICHDWNQVMDRISESGVKTAMHDFATSLHQLWERQDEEQRRRVKADHAFMDFEKQVQILREEKGRIGSHGRDMASDRVSLSMVQSKGGISHLDDLKVDLDTMRQKVRDQKAGHKEAVKLVHDAVSRSVQAGLIPIFDALESFTMEAAKAYENVRVQVPSGSKS